MRHGISDFINTEPCPANDVQRYLDVWESTKLDKSLSLNDSAVKELQLYSGYDEDTIGRILCKSGEILADEWNKTFRNRKITVQSVRDFYDKTELEIFELMDWHYNRYAQGPLQYVFALDVARRNGFKSYLDYGSGIGTGGILFALNKFRVTLADVSSTNLRFCMHRFKLRGIRAEFIDLKNQFNAKEKYDLITCFDVLEHTMNPLEILKTLRRLLSDKGKLIINIPSDKDTNKPMHIATNKDVINKIRYLGFAFNWDLAREYSENTGMQIYALAKVDRNIILNSAYCFYDSIPLKIRKTISSICRTIKGGLICRG